MRAWEQGKLVLRPLVCNSVACDFSLARGFGDGEVFRMSYASESNRFPIRSNLPLNIFVCLGLLNEEAWNAQPALAHEVSPHVTSATPADFFP